MKKNLLAVFIISLAMMSCTDDIKNPYPPTIATELDYTLYPGGDSLAYAATEWPTFTQNNNTLRNLLIEDFTGHLCTYCPPAADTAELLHDEYGDRIAVATIHAGPTGQGAFQQTSVAFPIDWTCEEGIAIGEHFGQDFPGSTFIGNPRGSVSRILSNGQHTLPIDDWRSAVSSNLSSQLKTNIQAVTNYYPSTRGVFLHTEIDVIDNAVLNDDLHVVVYLLEDSIVGKQKLPNNSTDDNYVHREVLRGCIGSTWEGRPITDAVEEGGKYYFNYSFALPTEYDDTNVHLLIYVRGGNYEEGFSEEVYQVIKQELQ